MSQRNEWIGILLGLVLVILVNIILIIPGGIFISSIIDSLVKSKSSSATQTQEYYLLFAAFNSICIYQLIYVTPTIFWLKRQQKFGLMKGVILGAVITALLTGACFITFLGSYVGA